MFSLDNLLMLKIHIILNIPNVTSQFILSQNYPLSFVLISPPPPKQKKIVSYLMPVFFKLSAVAGHFIGSWRTCGPHIFHKLPHTQRCMQVNRRNIIPVVKVAKAVLVQTCMSVFFFHSVSVQFLQFFFFQNCLWTTWQTSADHWWSTDYSLTSTTLCISTNKKCLLIQTWQVGPV
jgi:hypothetical protein